MQFDIHASVKHSHNDNSVFLILVKDDMLLMDMFSQSGRDAITSRADARIINQKLESLVQAFEVSPTLRGAPSLLCIRGYPFQIRPRRSSEEQWAHWVRSSSISCINVS